MHTIDIVYPLGTGSKWNNNELRYSLRSVEKHLKNFRNIYIIGESCSLLRFNEDGLYFIPFADRSIYNPNKNIYLKLLSICTHPELSENFLMMNDDFFLLSDIDATSVPYYCNGDIHNHISKRSQPGDPYKTTLENTIKALKKRNMPLLHYDGHAPIIYNKNQFTIAVSSFNWNVPYGYAIKSLYCNSFQLPLMHLDDCKVNRQLTEHDIYAKISGRDFFSIGDKGLNPALKEVIKTLYPEKSKFEI